MGAPTNTYNSPTNLSIGSVPQVEDESLYTALLDIHNALEILLTSSDVIGTDLATFTNKHRANITVTVGAYTVEITDGTIEVDASGGDVIITLHPVSEGVGFRYDIKRVDTVTTNRVTLLGDGTEYIDGHTSGINISTLSSYTVKTNSDQDGWNII